MYHYFIAKKVRLPVNAHEQAKSIVDIATGEKITIQQDQIKETAKVLGRKGGLKVVDTEPKIYLLKNGVELPIKQQKNCEIV